MSGQADSDDLLRNSSIYNILGPLGTSSSSAFLFSEESFFSSRDGSYQKSCSNGGSFAIPHVMRFVSIVYQVPKNMHHRDGHWIG